MLEVQEESQRILNKELDHLNVCWWFGCRVMGFFLRSATGLREWIGKDGKVKWLKKKYFFAWYVINPGNFSLYESS